jgi:outer membrane protein OmpA-like peptidoglycan-associated protein/tetratricopeptide (TPR) repeat protein
MLVPQFMQINESHKTKEMKRRVLVLIGCMAFTLLIQAQSVREARVQMGKYNYAKAIEILKALKDVDKARAEAIPLLAECYRLQRDFVNAKIFYAEAIDLPEAKPEYTFYYAQALQATGDYPGARDMFQEYVIQNPSDPRGKLFAAHCDSVLGPWRKFAQPFEKSLAIAGPSTIGAGSEKPGDLMKGESLMSLNNYTRKPVVPLYEVKLAPGINSRKSDFGPAFYMGELTFASDTSYDTKETKEYGWTGSGYLSIVKSRPLTEGDFWGAMETPSLFNEKFEQVYHDGPASFNADANIVYFTRSYFGKAKRIDRFKTNMLKIYYSVKYKDVWDEPKPFYLNTADYSVGHPSLSANGQSLFFASDMPGGRGGTDIYMCRREGDGWGPVIRLDSTLNTEGNEMFPTIRQDGVLFFASDGQPGYGGLDIFRTKYINGHWTSPENLQAPINSSFDDFAIAFAPGYKNGFFSSNRLGGVGEDDIYAFRDFRDTIVPAVAKSAALVAIGYVKDKNSSKPLADATVFMLNSATGKVKILKTGDDGMYTTNIDNPAEYILKAMKSGFMADCLPFSVADLKPGTTIMNINDLLLDPLVLNKTVQIENIYYDFDKYDIRNDANPQLDNVVQVLKENPILIELGSHTDSRGSAKYNQKLSQKRAEAVVRYIVSKGIGSDRITAKGYGESKLINKCTDGVTCTDEEQQANRRTEFKVIGMAVVQMNSEYDLNKFVAGEEMTVFVFSTDFFSSCLSGKTVPKYAPFIDINKALVPAARKEQHLESAPILTDQRTAASRPATIFYKVQLFSLNTEKSLKDPEFAAVDDVEMFIENGKYKYTSGTFLTYEQAYAYRTKMLELGFPDAFILKILPNEP